MLANTIRIRPPLKVGNMFCWFSLIATNVLQIDVGGLFLIKVAFSFSEVSTKEKAKLIEASCVYTHKRLFKDKCLLARCKIKTRFSAP
jgi:hypothetical protein